MEEKKEKYWSRYASDYDAGVDYVVGKALNQAIFDRLLNEHLGKVIEFGCGSGYFTRAIARNAEHVTATDLSDEMLEAAGANLKGIGNLAIQKADCRNSSFPSGKFDSVFLANIIHVIDDPTSVIQECRRILKPGGLLLAVDYTGWGMSLLEKIKLILRYIRKLGIPPRRVRSRLSADQLASLVESAGFGVENVRLIGDKTKALYLKCVKN